MIGFTIRDILFSEQNLNSQKLHLYFPIILFRHKTNKITSHKPSQQNKTIHAASVDRTQCLQNTPVIQKGREVDFSLALSQMS
jgi:hypothetical protein